MSGRITAEPHSQFTERSEQCMKFDFELFVVISAWYDRYHVVRVIPGLGCG